MNKSTAFAVAFLVIGLSAPSAEVLFTLESPEAGAEGEFGAAISDCGDLNSDGFADR